MSGDLLYCERDERREAVRGINGRNGLDYVEVAEDGLTLHAYFLGKLPPELTENQPGLEKYLKIEGGERIREIKILDVDPVSAPAADLDDHLIIRIDKSGDFSTYSLRLLLVENIDPRYETASFSFKIDCPSDLDCASACGCHEPVWEEPDLNYLAKDYSSFRQLILDRLSLLVPNWTERHAPDIGIAVVEAMAYLADYLSYYQDAVATEAYLDTARQRISVRRHCRLVDYTLHEGCSARAWLCLTTDSDFPLALSHVSFITGLNDALLVRQSTLNWDDLRGVSSDLYLVFEPVSKNDIKLRTAHNLIRIYTWGNSECCLAKGSTQADLVDTWNGEQGRALALVAGDILVFEEVLGPGTGLAADANPINRHAVRISRVTAGIDPVVRTAEGRPTPYVTVEWLEQDAIPFPICISTLGPSPRCQPLTDISIVRGNVILVDHGRTVGAEDLGTVGVSDSSADCECAGQPGEVFHSPRKLRPVLAQTPLTWRTPVLTGEAESAASTMLQDPREAMPHLSVSSEPQETWIAQSDFFNSHSDDHHFVAEMDDAGAAHLRFGDGVLGFQPPAGMKLSATYRIGNGIAGNVGAEAICRMVLRDLTIEGASITVRNPLPASGGVDPESVADAKLMAPQAFRKKIERAIIAEDYETIAERNTAVQKASAELVWTGSWYEADVAIDPLGSAPSNDELLKKLYTYLDRYRRIGHDLHLERAIYVPIDLELEVCALPGYPRAQVRAGLLDLFSDRVLRGGRLGYFHPDSLTFGASLYLSQIVAKAQVHPGVECARVTRLQRLFLRANGELESGVLPLHSHEIAQLDSAPNHPERGKLVIHVQGGR